MGDGTFSALGNVRLRYSAAPVLDRAELGAGVVTHLYQGDAFTMLSDGGAFCQVRLANGVTGFVLTNNLTVPELSPPPVAMAEQ